MEANKRKMSLKTQRLLIIITMGVISAVIVVLGIVLILAPKVQAAVTPTTYDQLKVQAFLLQSNGGVTNAQKLGINANDVSSWGEYFWFSGGGDLVAIERKEPGSTLNVTANLHGILDVSGCASLSAVRINGNPLITSVNVANCQNLSLLYVSGTGITAIDVSVGNQKLTDFRASGTSVTSVNVTGNPVLYTFDISYTGVTTLNLSANTELRNLYINNANIQGLSITSNKKLEVLFAQYNPNIDAINVYEHPNLRSLNIDGTAIMSLNLTKNEKINYLVFHYTSVFNLTNPDSTVPGQTFEGWYTTSNHASGTKVDPFVNNTIYTVYPKWHNMLTIDYNLKPSWVRNDVFNPNRTSWAYGIGFELENASCPGYYFEGWYDAATGGNRVYEIQDTEDQNKFLWARWTAITYYMTYRGIIAGHTNPTSWVYGVTTKFTLTAPAARAGFTFDGWYTLESGGTKVLEIDNTTLGNQTVWARWVDSSGTIQDPNDPETTQPFSWEFAAIIVGFLLLLILLVVLLTRRDKDPSRTATNWQEPKNT